ncbi:MULTISPECIES: zinc ribbon domain-containing protein [Bacillus]|uniref:zinc ribbon domain-containing protein n=1 Tax=Bacillus TaxID=1386 RepID=UPI00040E2B51|nr:MULTISPECIES: zinc ribbon domain-containing protein [Bacillus]
MKTLICQSCGMPMDHEELGTEKGGGKNRDYCKYCYGEGQFKQPDATLQDMIEICVPYLKEEGKTEVEARKLLESTLPHLKRWRSAAKETGTSFSHFEKLNTKQFTGISTVTSNKEEASGKGKISSMWEWFHKNSPLSSHQIPRDIIALYSDYETDEHGSYTFSIGTFGEPEDDDRNVITLPASEYAVFISRRGRLEEVVFDTWRDIWGWEQKQIRTYTGDFEVYNENAADRENAQVAIYVAVQRGK